MGHKKGTKPEKLVKPKYIESPEKMWTLFEEYSKKTKANPILVHDFVGKDAVEVERKKERPLTMEGFECYVANQGLNTELSHYFSNKDGRYNSYVAVCSRIRKSIRHDQIEGGMSGIYNPSITQRLNNLVENVDVKTNGNAINSANTTLKVISEKVKIVSKTLEDEV